MESNITFDSYEQERIFKLDEEISSARVMIKKNSLKLKIFIPLLLAGLTLIVLGHAKILAIPIWLFVIIYIFTFAFFGALTDSDNSKYRSIIDRNELLKKLFTGAPDSAGETIQYFDRLVKINVENLAAYYTIVKVHASQSFQVSLLVGVLGFGLIIAGLASGFLSKEFKDISYIASGSGIIVEFISGTMFYLYNKTVRQLKDYHDSLIDVQNVLLSFKLIESTTDEKVRAEMISKMIEFLVKKDKVNPT
jgi:hypothetical protein